MSSSGASYSPFVLHLLRALTLLCDQTEGRERLMGGETAGEEKHSLNYGERARGEEEEIRGTLPQLHHEDDE